jgi:methionyl-tRNA synthetase
LFKELVDLGPQFGRVTVISGLANFMKPEDLVGKKALFLQNLKPMKMRGIESCAMILAASNADHTAVEVVFPPQDAEVGERVTVAGFAGEPDMPFMNPKKKIWEALVPELSTSEALVATWRNVPLMTTKGPCTVKSLVGAGIH